LGHGTEKVENHCTRRIFCSNLLSTAFAADDDDLVLGKHGVEALVRSVRRHVTDRLHLSLLLLIFTSLHEQLESVVSFVRLGRLSLRVLAQNDLNMKAEFSEIRLPHVFARRKHQ